MSEGLRCEDRGAVRTITISRPEKKNAITLELLREMSEKLDEAAASREIRAVAIAGDGGSFCSGADLGNVGGGGERVDIEAAIRADLHGTVRRLRAVVEKPTVALVDGTAVGFGCDLAMACDIRLCSSRAVFSELFGRRGLVPDGGGTFHLPRIVGLGRAMELFFTGEKVDAQEAWRIGLANKVWPAESFADEARAYLDRLARTAPLAVAYTKRCVNAALDATLETALANEARHQLLCLRSNDFMEGLSAFFAKREPDFKGD
ncbi:MAG TPA: enoyl-CoA hydratase-related protein [Myxococcota bacterium]|jgi:enoyl-CoA hydratase/carnithine racemase|nr:enoyl-CoA hydratase-related protein [Myxococcota bacterium]